MFNVAGFEEGGRKEGSHDIRQAGRFRSLKGKARDSLLELLESNAPCLHLDLSLVSSMPDI